MGSDYDAAVSQNRIFNQRFPRVEHPFHVIKNLFGFRKVRYRGLAKNTAQLHTLFALANLVLTKRGLLAGLPA